MNGPSSGLLSRLVEIRSSPFLTRSPARLTAFEDGIEVASAQGRFWKAGRTVQRVAYREIAQVIAENNGRLLASHSVLVRTTDGEVLSLRGLTATTAERVTTLLIERMIGV